MVDLLTKSLLKASKIFKSICSTPSLPGHFAVLHNCLWNISPEHFPSVLQALSLHLNPPSQDFEHLVQLLQFV